MPTYEYACQSCDHEFEQFQSMKDAPLEECPECGEKKLKRLVGGGAGLIFKGTGFYITDYRKPGGGGEGKAGETKTSSDPKGASESKSTTDSKGASASKSPAPAKTAAATATKS